MLPRVNRSFERHLGRLVATIVEFSGARPSLTVSLCLLATAGAVFLAVTILEADTDSDRTLTSDLPVRRANLALEAAFPNLQRNLVVMVEADDPFDARDAAEELSAKLRSDPERYPGVFLPGEGEFFEDFGLFFLEDDELEELADRIDMAGPLIATLADRPELPTLIGALTHTIGSEDGLDGLGEDGPRILNHLSEAVERFNAGGHAPVPWEDLLFDDVGGEPDNPQLLFVRPSGDLSLLPPVLEALADIRALAEGLETRPGLRVRITGDRAVHTEEMTLIIDEAILTGIASLVLVAGVLFYALRSFRLVLATVVTLLVGLSWTAGLAAIAVGSLSALTSAFAVLYVGLGVDFGIHFALGYFEQLDRGLERHEALRATGTGVGSSLLLCALTTATGFYAFIPTAYSGVGDMGIISGSGVFLGLLATITIYPALIALGLGDSPRASSGSGRLIDISLPSFPIRYPAAVCGVAAVVAIACTTSLAWVRFDANTLNVRDPRVESVQALKDLLEDEARSVWTIEILTGDLEEARQLAEELEMLEGIDHVNTAVGFMPDDPEGRLAIFEQMRADLVSPVDLTDAERAEGFDRLTAVDYTIEGYGVALDLDAELRGDADADDPTLIAAERLREALYVVSDRLENEYDLADLDALEADLLGELPTLLQDVVDAVPERTFAFEELPRDLIDRYLAPDGRARVEVFSTLNLDEPGALEEFTDLVLSVRPDAGGPAAGTVGFARAIVDSLRQALGMAVVVNAMLLLVLLRSAKFTVITLTPLFVGAVTTAAVSVFANVPFNYANIIVLPLILGIGVDSGIHLVHRHRMGLSGARNMLATSTALGVLFSALTTMGSFSTLALSNHLGISSLGLLLTIGIGLMLIANIVVLPALLTLVDGKRESG